MKRVFRLFFAILLFLSSFQMKAQINMIVKEGGFLFKEGKDSICFYQRNPRDKEGQYSRCNYFHPLYELDGSRITEDFPADHLHHRGVFWAWHQILINDKPVADGWELKNYEQKVTNIEFKTQKGVGIFTTEVVWKSPLWKGGSEYFLKENNVVMIYPRKGNYRRIDFEIQLNPLVDHLSIGGSDDEKGYSGFSIRLKLPEEVLFSDLQGAVEPMNAAVIAGNAMKIDGRFLKNGGNGGVLIYSNPGNPKPSNRWILRKSASMQNVAYPGRNPITIPMDHPLTLNYSLLIYRGNLSQNEIKKVLKDIHH